jgi:hypothetical protein
MQSSRIHPSATAGLVPALKASVYHPPRKSQQRTVRELGLQNLEDFGAGEGIRTLDPDLGKVVLYP